MSKEILKKHNLKATLGRMAVLDLFGETGCKPMDAESIYKKLKGKSLDLVTVYRTLASFEEKGILKRVDLHKDSVYYELSGDAQHHHHHMICTACGLIEGFDACNIDALARKALKESSKFKAVSEHSLELFGMCKSCARR